MSVLLGETVRAGYEVLSQEPVPHARGTFYDLVHTGSGARLLHLSAPLGNNFFGALYRTHAPDDTGVPHIMEHCVSGGARMFPPGAGGMMYQRSLVNDLNAMTWPDHTIYYAASRHPDDLMNWVDYMIDVTLYPLLTEDTLYVHRGRLQLSDPSSPTSELVYAGTLYNEQKAQLGSPPYQAKLALMRALFPRHPYANHSGGDPIHIPQLTYAGLRDFYARFYHAGNLVMISAGEIELDRLLARVEEIALSQVPVPTGTAMMPEAQPLPAPVVERAGLFVPPGSEGATGGRVVLGWATIPVTDAYSRLVLDVAVEALFGDAGVVREALAGSGLARDGLSVDVVPLQRVMVMLEFPGRDVADGERIEEAVVSHLRRIGRNGLDARALGAAMRRTEHLRRDRSAPIASYREGVTPAVVHGGNPAAALAFEADIARLRANPGDVDGLIREHLADSTWRARVTLGPDPAIAVRYREAEDELNQRLRAAVTEADRQAVVARASQPPPRPASFDRGLRPEQGARELQILASFTHDLDGVPLSVFEAPTGGVTYLDVRIDTSDIDPERAPALGLLARAWGQRARRLAPEITSVTASVKAGVDAGGERGQSWIHLSLSALERDSDALAFVLAGLTDGLALTADELSAIAATGAAGMQGNLMDSAQLLLRILGGSKLRRSLQTLEGAKGLTQMRWLRTVAGDRAVAGAAATKVQVLREELMSRARIQLCLTTSTTAVSPLADALQRALAEIAGGAPTNASESDLLDRVEIRHEARTMALPVTFNCEVFAIPGITDELAPARAVLGWLQWFDCFNPRIRKGGAYGVDQASVPLQGMQWISSRRDPLVAESYAIFEEGIAMVRDGRRGEGPIASGMLPALRETETSESPHDAALDAWEAGIAGRTPEVRNAFRRAIAAVTEDQLQRAAATLTGGVRASLGSADLINDAGNAGLFDTVEEA